MATSIVPEPHYKQAGCTHQGIEARRLAAASRFADFVLGAGPRCLQGFGCDRRAGPVQSMSSRITTQIAQDRQDILAAPCNTDIVLIMTVFLSVCVSPILAVMNGIAELQNFKP